MEQNTDKQIEYLREFVSEERYARLCDRLQRRTRRMVLCLEDIFHPHNASATIRSAEAFGLQEVHAVQSLCPFLPSHDIVRGTDQWLDIERWDNTAALVGHLRERRYRIVVTTPREGSATVEDFDVNAGPFAVFMGTEKTGISDWLIKQADHGLYIPMHGFAESLNISVSAAILIQRLTERLRMLPCEQWQLSDDDKRATLLKWLKCSVKDVENVLKRLPIRNLPL